MPANVLETLREWLTSESITFREVQHAPTATSEESAKARGEDLRVGGKALVMRTDNAFALFVLPADRKADSAAIRRELKCGKLRFACREELWELTGLVPGSVPPFGVPILPFPLYVDAALQNNDRIAFNAGSLTDSIILGMEDYLRLAKPERVFDFSSPSPIHAIHRVCVFCGSNMGTDSAYRQSAEELGREIVRRGWELVYGGGSVGLMGALADAVLAAGGVVTGVIPEMLATKELLHSGVTHMHVAPTMHARKALMEELADAFIALPGGFGTFEELLEIITWAQLGIHAKPIGLLNLGGFYDGLTGFFDQAINQGFIKQKHRDLIVKAATASELCDLLVRHEMPHVKKWINRSEA